MKVNPSVVERRMAELELKTVDFAKASGLSQYTIYKILRGLTDPKPATVGKIARALQIDVSHIIESE